MAALSLSLSLLLHPHRNRIFFRLPSVGSPKSENVVRETELSKLYRENVAREKACFSINRKVARKCFSFSRDVNFANSTKIEGKFSEREERIESLSSFFFLYENDVFVYFKRNATGVPRVIPRTEIQLKYRGNSCLRGIEADVDDRSRQVQRVSLSKTFSPLSVRKKCIGRKMPLTACTPVDDTFLSSFDYVSCNAIEPCGNRGR